MWILTNQQAAWWRNALQLPSEKMLWNPSIGAGVWYLTFHWIFSQLCISCTIGGLSFTFTTLCWSGQTTPAIKYSEKQAGWLASSQASSQNLSRSCSYGWEINSGRRPGNEATGWQGRGELCQLAWYRACHAGWVSREGQLTVLVWVNEVLY